MKRAMQTGECPGGLLCSIGYYWIKLLCIRWQTCRFLSNNVIWP